MLGDYMESLFKTMQYENLKIFQNLRTLVQIDF